MPTDTANKTRQTAAQRLAAALKVAWGDEMNAMRVPGPVLDPTDWTAKGSGVIDLEEIARRALDDFVLPCDIRLPPATIIRKGCTLTTLLTAMQAREGMTLEWHPDDK